ncbi:hypothetical protein KKG48_03445 [Patescibacteria group bacterium]|nr:hypothetical protein [Patescibacteria group bacterium]MCG2694579.1 hypothetical protein [Candidatus Parcubacteria bacterium]
MSHELSADWPKRHFETQRRLKFVKETIQGEIQKGTRHSCKKLPDVICLHLLKGYCCEFSGKCEKCLLSEDGYCSSPTVVEVAEKTVFWSFIAEIRNNNSNLFEALGLINKLLTRVCQDHSPVVSNFQ